MFRAPHPVAGVSLLSVVGAKAAHFMVSDKDRPANLIDAR
jgi:hypothetical protein